MNRAAFYDAARGPIFQGALKASQVTTIEAILDAAEERGTPLVHLAYMLATARWEPGEDMKPREENLFYSTAARIRAVWPSRFPTVAAAAPFAKNPRGLANKVYNGRMGNRAGSDDGWTYRGRGLVQITGRDNYERAGGKIGVDLIAAPERALELPISVAILIDGMEGGWFTGRTSADGARVPGYEDDRAIINGKDKAATIAAIAVNFETALRAGGWGAGQDSGGSADLGITPEEMAALRALSEWQAEAPDAAAWVAWRAVNAWMEARPA